jgi:hypothetical protein
LHFLQMNSSTNACSTSQARELRLARRVKTWSRLGQYASQRGVLKRPYLRAGFDPLV